MKKISQLLSQLPNFLRDCLEILFPENCIRDLLFFDIETTGLSAKTSSLYLIGACYYNEEKQTFQLIQYFADEYDDEPKILKEFYQLSQDFTLLLHYNGRSFDLPYLNEKCEIFQMPFRFFLKNREHPSILNQKEFDSIETEEIDIYQIFHKDKIFFNGNLFPLENKKQKTIEMLAGYNRNNTFNGKELIRIYGDYRREHKMHHKKEASILLSILLLHNHDDLYGLISICPLIGYSLLFRGKFLPFILETCQFIENRNPKDASSCSNADCFLHLEIKTNFTFLPIPNFSFTNVTIKSHSISLRIPGKFTELKFFFPDYKNYYYLPDEDMAIHKSIASFVDKKRRQKAAPSTCYIKKSGYFFPQPAKNPVVSPLFYQEYQERIAWFQWTEKLIEQKDLLINYAIAYLTLILQS